MVSTSVFRRKPQHCLPKNRLENTQRETRWAEERYGNLVRRTICWLKAGEMDYSLTSGNIFSGALFICNDLYVPHINGSINL